MKNGKLSVCWRMRRASALRRARRAGSARAALLSEAPWLKIQFMIRSSNAPPCLMPATPQFERASTGTIVVEVGRVHLREGMLRAAGIGFSAEGADLCRRTQDWRAIHSTRSKPSFGSSAIIRHVPRWQSGIAHVVDDHGVAPAQGVVFPLRRELPFPLVVAARG